MKNIKKVLAVLLTAIMIFSTMSVGASAAISPNAFTSTQAVELESEVSLYIRSFFRKMFNGLFENIGLRDAVKATDVEFDSNKATVEVGSTTTVKAEVKPSKASNKNIRYESDNTAIASINANGVVKGVGQGVTTVYAIAEDGGFYAKCSVTVVKASNPCTTLLVGKKEVSLTIGSSETLRISKEPENTTDKLSLTNSNPTAVSASLKDGNLLLQGKSKGSATVTVKCGNKSASVSVTVTDIDCTKVQIASSNYNIALIAQNTITKQPMLDIEYTLTPNNTTDEVRYFIDKADILEIMSVKPGVITLLPLKPGTATITISCGNSSDKAAIKVEDFSHITWSYNEDTSTLKIGGKGDIPDCDHLTAPWSGYLPNASYIEIDKGITRIGKNAFLNTDNLKEITIPSTCKSLGATFLGQNKIEVLELPEGLVTVDNLAFAACYNEIEYLYIPSTLKKLNDIPNISGYFEVSEDNSNYSSEDGVLFNKNKTALISFPSHYAESNKYVMPDSVIEIKENAMRNGVGEVETLYISGNVTRFGANWIGNGDNNLTEIIFGRTTIPGDMIVPRGLSSLYHEDGITITVNPKNAYFAVGENGHVLYTDDYRILCAITCFPSTDENVEIYLHEDLHMLAPYSLSPNSVIMKNQWDITKPFARIHIPVELVIGGQLKEYYENYAINTGSVFGVKNYDLPYEFVVYGETDILKETETGVVYAPIASGSSASITFFMPNTCVKNNNVFYEPYIARHIAVPKETYVTEHFLTEWCIRAYDNPNITLATPNTEFLTQSGENYYIMVQDTSKPLIGLQDSQIMINFIFNYSDYSERFEVSFNRIYQSVGLPNSPLYNKETYKTLIWEALSYHPNFKVLYATLSHEEAMNLLDEIALLPPTLPSFPYGTVTIDLPILEEKMGKVDFYVFGNTEMGAPEQNFSVFLPIGTAVDKFYLQDLLEEEFSLPTLIICDEFTVEQGKSYQIEAAIC